jgi:hypothetical protein
MERLSLPEIVAQLRSDLTEAVRAAVDEELRFEVGPIEVELEVGFERTGGTGGKVSVWVLELNASGEVSETRTHRLKFVLQPVNDTDDEGRLLIGGRQSGRPE